MANKERTSEKDTTLSESKDKNLHVDGIKSDELPQINNQQVDENLEVMARRSAKHHKKWNRRLKILFCCLGYKKNKESIADVASIFAEFYSDLDVPSSDIAAGFVMLSKYQAKQRQWILENQNSQGSRIEQYLSNLPITEGTRFLDISSAEDSHLINDLIYYMNYSLAIFGWPMSMIDDPCLLCCIYPYLRLSPCCSGKSRIDGELRKERKSNVQASQNTKPDTTISSTNVEDHESASKEKVGASIDISEKLSPSCDMPIILEDNCCSCNAASAERRLAQHNYEIIYVSYKSSINVVPFLVAADHSKQTIVVAIRGSMSLSDMVTDMNGTVDKVPVDGCPDDWLCHRGITNVAMYVRSALLQEHILDRAFNCRPDLGTQNYNLVLCGHSLGAGAAAILGVLMRENYPSLKAFLYSPPGGILSLPVVEYTKQFAIGIILGNDTVPRLGVAQLERLRYHTLLSLKSAHRSPGRILARALCPSICFGRNDVEYDPELSLDLLYGTVGRSFSYNGTKIPFQVQPQVLYVPGKLVHIVKNYSFKSNSKKFCYGPIYQAVWTDNKTYDRIMISDGMFLDHLPNNLMHAMKMLFSKTLPGRRESASTPEVVNDSEVIESSGVLTAKSLSSLIHDKMNIEGVVTKSDISADDVTLTQSVNSIKDDNNNDAKDYNDNHEVDSYNPIHSASNPDNRINNCDGIKTKDNLDENGNER